MIRIEQPAAGSGPAVAGTGRPARILWVLLVAAALLPFLPALHDGFTFDDRAIIVENPATWAASPAASWSTPYWPDHAGSGLYRPWTSFSFWWNGRLTGRGPWGFHAVNLLLHAAVVLLLYALLRRLFPDRRMPALVAALFFAVHPLHAEAVVSLVGRAELWAAVLGLSAWLLAIDFSRRGNPLRLGAAATAFLLAMLSKESAAGLVVLPAFHVVLDGWSTPAGATTKSGRRRWLMTGAVWIAVLLVVLALRARVLGQAAGIAGVSLSDNALAHESAPARILHALGIQWLLVGRTLFPSGLAADASYPQIVPGAGWTVAGVLFLAAFLALTGLAWRLKDRALAWGIAIVLAGGFVTSNVPMAVGTIYAERLAYLPSAGSIWILTLAAARLGAGARFRRVIPVLAVVWGLFLAGRSWARSLDWQDDLTLFKATTVVSPRSAKAWTNLAVALLEHDRVPEALDASGRALALYPGFGAAREARGTALTRSGRAAEAVEILGPALHEVPPRPRSLIELGNAWLSLRQGVPAESAFTAAARVLPPTDPASVIGLASSYAVQGRWREAASTWRQAARRKPADAAVQRSFAWSLWQAGAVDSAESIYHELLARDARDAASRNELAWLLARSRRDPPQAVGLARAAFRLQPDAETADTLLEALLVAEGSRAAAAWLDSLAAAAPEFLTPEAQRTLRERWERGPGSATLDSR